MRWLCSLAPSRHGPLGSLIDYDGRRGLLIISCGIDGCRARTLVAVASRKNQWGALGRADLPVKCEHDPDFHPDCVFGLGCPCGGERHHVQYRPSRGSIQAFCVSCHNQIEEFAVASGLELSTMS
jgi:hypothetical protein